MARPGDRIDIWVVEQALGTGGMGSVYRCHNADAPRILAAVKVLDSSLRASEDAVRRFVREAEILNRLDHPNVVRVRNVRTDHEPPFLEMEFVEGDSLEDRISQGPLPLKEAITFARQLAEALAYVHTQNVRHRDVKPANLLITSGGQLKLVDFGLAMETDLTRITQAGMAFGTVAYAPPEWIDPMQIDPVQWDLYAVGVILWEMVRGQWAFPTPAGGSPKQQALQVILAKQNAPPLDLEDGYPEVLRSLIRELTAATPDERPRSALDVVGRLDRIYQVLERRGWNLSLTPHLSEVSTEVPPARRGSRRPTSMGPLSMAPEGLPQQVLLGFIALATLAAVVAGVGVALWQPMDVSPRDLLVSVADLPADYPVSVRIDGEPPVLREASGWLFEQVPIGVHELSWVAGEGCALESCDEGGCPPWCGSGLLPVEVEAGAGPQRVTVDLELPEPGVVISVPSIQDARVGLFRRRPKYRLTATLDGRLGGVFDDYKAAWRDVVPGRRELVVSVGECPQHAIGCYPGRVCPEGCTSTVREVIVPFGERGVSLSLDLPVPE